MASHTGQFFKPTRSTQDSVASVSADGSGGDLAHTASAQLIGSSPQAPDALPIVGEPCPACGAPREGGTRFCNSCGSPFESANEPTVVPGSSGSDASALPNHTFQCENCGSQVATSLDQRSYICPFCDSSYVTEIPIERSGRQRPEFVIGFSVTADQAREKFFEWLKQNSWFRPGDLATKAVSDKQKGVYLPFWHFSMEAESSWSARIGEYWYRTETYTTTDSKGKTVTRTRQVRETEWFPLSGEFQRYYHGYLVPATRGISHAESDAIQPFQLSTLARYRPYFLAGWMAEEYSVSMDEAIEQTKQEFRRRQEVAIGNFLPGDTYAQLAVTTRLEVNGSDLILLPVHVLSYRYRDRLFRFLVNGQTGKVVGEKPLSKKRIAALVVFIVILVALIFGAFYFLSQ
jgi:hypothetical protein